MEIHIKRVAAAEKAEQRGEREPDSRKLSGGLSGKNGRMRYRL